MASPPRPPLFSEAQEIGHPQRDPQTTCQGQASCTRWLPLWCHDQVSLAVFVATAPEQIVSVDQMISTTTQGVTYQEVIHCCHGLY